MKLLKREEKINKKLFNLYNKYINDGMKPQKAIKKAKEDIGYKK